MKEKTKAKMTAEQMIEFVQHWVERERQYEINAVEKGDKDLANDCHRRIFTLNLLLINIGGL
jgi:hypothetical protein